NRNRSVARGRGRARAQSRQRWRSRPVLSRDVILRHVQKLRRSRRSISQTGAIAPVMKPIKIPRLFNAKKLLTATARRASAASAGVDFEGIPEPNMKLSRALLIVLLLHVVAVSGIIAFNAIKTGEGGFVPATSTETEDKPAENAQPANRASTEKARVEATQKENDRQHEKPSHSPAKDEQVKTPSSSGKTY